MNGIVLQTLLRRELYRFVRLAGQTIAPPIVSTLLFILVFGYALGGAIRELHGFPYVHYLLPGLTIMGVLNNAFSNTSTSLYAARFDRSIENWIAAPISPLQFEIALIAGGVARGVIIGVLSLLVGWIASGLPVAHPLAALLWCIVVSVIFACAGIVSGLRADSWDHLATMSNFVLMPLSYLGGVFYSIEQLPGIWQWISLANPLYYCIDGFRWCILGISDVAIGRTALVMALLLVLGVTVCRQLIARGYRLVK